MTAAAQIISFNQPHTPPSTQVAAPSSLTSFAVSISEMKSQVNLIQHIMKEVMKNGEHFGVIPGCGDKPALLKPGAEKLMLTFRLANDVEVDTIDLQHGHREYRIKVTLYSPTGQRLGTGIGSCSTMEGKYRFRVGPTELTNTPVPKDYWDLRKENPVKAQEIIGGRGYSPKKDESGIWMIARQGEKVEYDNPADYYNTCLKMAKKRGLVDAVLTSTAASDIFTQDIEEDPTLYMRVAARTNAAESQKSGQTTPTTEPVFEEAHVVEEPHVKPVTASRLADPQELLQALQAKGIKYEIRDNLVAAAPSFSDADGRSFVKSLGFKWDGKTKEWTKFL